MNDAAGTYAPGVDRSVHLCTRKDLSSATIVVALGGSDAAQLPAGLERLAEANSWWPEASQVGVSSSAHEGVEQTAQACVPRGPG